MKSAWIRIVIYDGPRGSIMDWHFSMRIDINSQLRIDISVLHFSDTSVLHNFDTSTLRLFEISALHITETSCICWDRHRDLFVSSIQFWPAFYHNIFPTPDRLETNMIGAFLTSSYPCSYWILVLLCVWGIYRQRRHAVLNRRHMSLSQN